MPVDVITPTSGMVTDTATETSMDGYGGRPGHPRYRGRDLRGRFWRGDVVVHLSKVSAEIVATIVWKGLRAAGTLETASRSRGETS